MTPTDRHEVDAFLERYGADQAATLHMATVVLGERLGLYRAMYEGGPQTPAELADRTGCHRRLVAEWLAAQAVSDYCVHDPATGTYALTPAQAACLADPSSPTFVVRGLRAANAIHRSEERVRHAFTGDGAVPWDEHPEDLFVGVDGSFRAPYAAMLVPEWIPALEGVEERLTAGGRAADLGCGYGTTTILLGEAFPASRFSGFDLHEHSIEVARKAAAEAGVSDRVTFEVAAAEELPGGGYDLVCSFNALHEMGDPLGVLRRVRAVLAEDGTVMIVELNAGAGPHDPGPVARSFYAASTFVCVPNALAQGASEALGAQASDEVLASVALRAGFTRFRRVAETPLHRVLELRP